MVRIFPRIQSSTKACAKGERVQFFRLEAEKDRFMEKVEKVQSDMLRCIKSWSVTRDAWKQRASHFTSESLHGKASFALQQADMHQEMIERMKLKMYSTGYGHLLYLKEGEAFWKHVQAVRDGKAPLRMTMDDLVREGYSLPVGLAESIKKDALAASKRREARGNRKERK